MREKFTKLVNSIAAYAVIPEDQLDALCTKIVRRVVDAGDYFEKAGSVSHEFCFVEKGLFRAFFRDANGDEFIKNFATEGQILGSFHSLLTQKPSQLSIQALEDSTILVLDYSVFQEFCQNSHHWETCGRLLAQHIFLESDRKEQQLMIYNAAERYELFLKSHKNIIKRIHQYMIAMYLGISPVSLSRIIHTRPKASKS